ncbi:MAG: acyl-CoA dehydrogenase family protein [Acidimicrobiia bacterium]|nr:acyl-CoA dehydrogenase family protein [Acidimicrobiia bacterium]
MVSRPAVDGEQFRQELRSWLAEHPSPSIAIATTGEEAETLREWQRTLFAGGWVGIHWPEECGGRGASVLEVAIFNEEMARARAADIPGKVGLSLVGPALMAYGNEQQKSQWMPRILNGDDVWCQLFSEPGAGSDLTGLSTRAERHDDVYLVTGQKVWTTYAQFSDTGIALVRTDPDAPKSKGISMLAVPMDAEGVDVRPLRQMTGDSEFNEVFLDEVEVPVENLIGPEHGGWRAASTVLANERGGGFIWKQQVRQEDAVDRLWKTCAGAGLFDDPLVRQRLAQAWIEAELFRLHNARTLARLAQGEELGAESSLVKLFWSETSKRFYETAYDLVGASAADEWTNDFLYSRANTIMGGSSEIQRNIIGERLLGLPR